MRNFLLFLPILFLSINVYSQKVDERDVLKIIDKVSKAETKYNFKLDKIEPLTSDSLIYVAKFKDKGFLIISGDYSAPPVLGKCDESIFNLDSLPGGLQYLIEKYKAEIGHMRKMKIEPTEDTKKKWDKYLTEKQVLSSLKSANSTQSTGEAHLIHTTWAQGTSTNSYDKTIHFNKYAPDMCKAGCCAVALAQVLFFWNWEIVPSGSNSYDGQSANFLQSNYCWQNMDLLLPDDDNAKLIYHAGISCDTDYCGDGNGSGANMDDVENALNTYWGVPDAELKYRQLHLLQWKNMLKYDLNYAMPVIYAANGHTWVIDGYNDDDNFYCNWGWGSDYPHLEQGWGNGWFSLGGFTPIIGDIQYDWSNFFLNEQAIFNIDPEPFTISNISGPSTLTSSATTFSVVKANCVSSQWTCSSNILCTYGGEYQGESYRAYKAVGSGTGWMQASYTINGITYASPKKYVTCAP